jgi:hypothetical protein
MRPHPISKKRRLRDRNRVTSKYRRINDRWQRAYDRFAAKVNAGWDKALERLEVEISFTVTLKPLPEPEGPRKVYRYETTPTE